jgi:hypothetical protein
LGKKRGSKKLALDRKKVVFAYWGDPSPPTPDARFEQDLEPSAEDGEGALRAYSAIIQSLESISAWEASQGTTYPWAVFMSIWAW